VGRQEGEGESGGDDESIGTGDTEEKEIKNQTLASYPIFPVVGCLEEAMIKYE